MSADAPLTVGIVGLGQIAQGYDEPTGPGISTHLKACLADPRLRVAWISDTDGGKAVEVRRRWNLSIDIVDPNNAPSRTVDIVCIASPDITHSQWVERFLSGVPRLILCEKPLVGSADRARELIFRAETAGAALVVNFMRRWIPGVASWLAAGASGEFGVPTEARLTYCRGLRHNACHGLDLIGAVLGDSIMSVSRASDCIDDFGEVDPTVSAAIEVQSKGRRVPVVIIGVDGRRRFAFDVEIVFETSRMRVWNEDGIRIQISGAGPQALTEFHDKPARHMQCVWRNLADNLLDNTPLLCRAAETLPGAVLIDAVANAPPRMAKESIS